jgi:hypothetical protein
MDVTLKDQNLTEHSMEEEEEGNVKEIGMEILSLALPTLGSV